jgi:ubiquinone/menaquinone biosynthesis C-methylase UbiE
MSGRAQAPELMDDPAVDPEQLAGNFDDIERANRWFGGIAPVRHEVFARKAESVLDVGCGSADVARALIREARHRGGWLDITCLDASAKVLTIARARSSREPEMRFVQADATALPFPDAAFDLVTCNLTLHHFEPSEAIAALKEFRRVARLTPLVCDLRRSALASAATRLFVAFFARNRLTKHDAPLSARRAYTPAEALDLARAAGWSAPRVRRYPFARMMLSDERA